MIFLEGEKIPEDWYEIKPTNPDLPVKFSPESITFGTSFNGVQKEEYLELRAFSGKCLISMNNAQNITLTWKKDLRFECQGAILECGFRYEGLVHTLIDK